MVIPLLLFSLSSSALSSSPLMLDLSWDNGVFDIRFVFDRDFELPVSLSPLSRIDCDLAELILDFYFCFTRIRRLYLIKCMWLQQMVINQQEIFFNL